MVAVLIGLILIVAFAVGVMAMVALPRLRSGEDLLTPEGRETIARVGERTRESSATAAGTTVSAVSTLRERVSTAWAPASDFLHQQIDRLESREETPADGVRRPASGPAGETGTSDADFGSADGLADGTTEGTPADPAAKVGRPRAVPAISGPIPEIDEDAPARGSGNADAAVISLREPGLDETRPHPRIR